MPFGTTGDMHLPANFQPTTHRIAKVMASIPYRPAKAAGLYNRLAGLYSPPFVLLILAYFWTVMGYFYGHFAIFGDVLGS